MNSYKHSLTKCNDFLETLKIDEQVNALWDVLHDARWHMGIDWVMWINDNTELIIQLTAYDYFHKCPDDLKQRIRSSLQKIKELNR